MESLKGLRILIVNDDREAGRSLSEIVKSQDMVVAEFTPSVGEGLAQGVAGFFDVSLVDVESRVGIIDPTAELRVQNPEMKIIALIAAGDKEGAVKALEHGAFDFLEKPIRREVLLHAIRRAAGMLENERAVLRLNADLQRVRSELSLQNKRLEHLQSKVMDTNKAFCAITRNIDMERDQMQKSVSLKIGSILMPAIDRLKRDRMSQECQKELSLITSLLLDLTADAVTDPRISSMLSPAELRIASLIKTGMSTEKIADYMCVSVSTVKTHIKTIRRKLKINDIRFSLKDFLMSVSQRKNPRMVNAKPVRVTALTPLTSSYLSCPLD